MNSDIFKSKWVLLLLLLLLLAGDTLTAIWLKDSFNYSWIFKAIISAVLLLNLYIHFTRKFYWLFLLFLGMCLGMIFNYQMDIIFKISQFFEYCSGILFFCFLLINNNSRFLRSCLLFVFLFYVITILGATLLQLDYFSTYRSSDRFGYMPLFSSQNEFSFIMIAIIIFFYNNALSDKKNSNWVWLLLSIISSLCVGTKVIYIFTLSFLVYLVYTYFGYIKSILITLGALFSLYITQPIWIGFIKSNFSVLYNVYEKKGVLNMLSSLRVEYLERRLPCQIENFEISNYFFGGLKQECATEMSLFDLLFFFGAVGIILYSFLIKKVILDELVLNKTLLFFIITITSLSLMAGYFFENLSAQIYTLSVLFIYYRKHDSLFRRKEMK